MIKKFKIKFKRLFRFSNNITILLRKPTLFFTEISKHWKSLSTNSNRKIFLLKDLQKRGEKRYFCKKYTKYFKWKRAEGMQCITSFFVKKNKIISVFRKILPS